MRPRRHHPEASNHASPSWGGCSDGRRSIQRLAALVQKVGQILLHMKHYTHIAEGANDGKYA